MKKLIGIDLGGTTVKLAVLNEEGDIIKKWEIPTNTSDNGKYILDDIANAVKAELTNLNIDIKDCLGAGIGVPGPVTDEGILISGVNLGWFEPFNINDKLSSLLGMPVVADNDANAATIGEMWKGSGSNARHMIFVTLGTGVGGGVITNGQIVRGNNGGGGEIGHIPVVFNDNAEKCNCGLTGCLETVASATGIVRETKKALVNYNGETTLRSLDNLTAKDIFDAAKNNDSFAVSMVDQLGHYLGLVLATLATTTNPSTIVIGGGVSKAGDILVNAIKKHFNKYVFTPNNNVDFRIAKLENDAGIYGAAYLAKNNL